MNIKEDKKEYILYISQRLKTTVQKETEEGFFDEYDVGENTAEYIQSLTETDKFNEFCKRCLRACKIYIKENEIDDPDNTILTMKLDFLLQKIDIEVLYNIIIEKTVRVKNIINSDIYDINKKLKREKNDLMSKIVDVSANSCSLYKCLRCGAKKHTYKEVVARSLDEPVIVKCECLVCGMKFNKG